MNQARVSAVLLGMFWLCVVVLTSPTDGLSTPDTHKLDPKAVKQNELLDKQFLDLYFRAMQALLRGDVNVAYTLIQAAQKFRPNSPRLYFLYGTMYKINKQYKEAIQFYQLAANGFNPKQELFEKSSAMYNVAMCYELTPDRPSAIAAWQSYATLFSSYPQESSSVAFAKARIQALSSVKTGPANNTTAPPAR